MPGAGAPVRWKQEAMTVKRMSAALPFAAAAAIVAAAGLAAGLVADASAETNDSAPMVAPYRIDDAPSAGKGAFALIDNFAWRAFVALGLASRPRCSRKARSNSSQIRSHQRRMSMRPGRP
jgi:hypothetical protein